MSFYYYKNMIYYDKEVTVYVKNSLFSSHISVDGSSHRKSMNVAKLLELIKLLKCELNSFVYYISEGYSYNVNGFKGEYVNFELRHLELFTEDQVDNVVNTSIFKHLTQDSKEYDLIMKDLNDELQNQIKECVV